MFICNRKAVVKVTNTGTLDGKETVQIYIKSPQGMLGKPERALIGFEKTKKLAAGATEELLISIPKKTYASYDDSGVTGYRSCYVLEAGEYEVFAGTDVRSAVSCGSFWENFLVVEKLEEAKLQSVKVNENVQEATSGLMVLGYSRKDIEKVFEHLAVESLSVEDLIKKGLVLLTTK